MGREKTNKIYSGAIYIFKMKLSIDNQILESSKR